MKFSTVSTLMVCAASVSALSVPNAPSCQEKPVIVVGAGLSGSSAARDLQDRGCDVIVLEGRDRVGGRTHTKHDWGFPIDIGGAYIHGGAIDNSIRWVAETKFGLNTIKSGGDSAYIGPEDKTLWIKPDGSPYTDSQVAAGFTLMDRWWTAVKTYSVDRQNKGLMDTNMETATNAVLKGFFKKNGNFIKLASTVQGSDDLEAWETDLLYMHLAKSYEEDWGLPLDQFGVFGHEEDFYWSTIRKEDRIVEGGMDQIVKKLLEPVDVKLRHVVEKIEHSESGAQVTVTDESTGESHIFEGSAVISTLPIGVLKNGDVEFNPPLSAEKHLSIDRRGIARQNHFYMEFDERFWEAEYSTFIQVAAQNENHDHFFEEWLCVSDMFQLDGKHVLSLFWTSDLFWHELDSDRSIRNAALDLLRAYYEPKGITVPNPKNYYATRYNNDRFSRGAYSGLRTYSLPEDWDNLAAPESNTLFFAGEHTNTEGRYQSVDTGIREAERIVNLPANSHITFPSSTWKNPKA
eukprot:Awhi_evm1s8186